MLSGRGRSTSRHRDSGRRRSASRTGTLREVGCSRERSRPDSVRGESCGPTCDEHDDDDHEFHDAAVRGLRTSLRVRSSRRVPRCDIPNPTSPPCAAIFQTPPVTRGWMCITIYALFVEPVWEYPENPSWSLAGQRQAPWRYGPYSNDGRTVPKPNRVTGRRTTPKLQLNTQKLQLHTPVKRPEKREKARRESRSRTGRDVATVTATRFIWTAIIRGRLVIQVTIPRSQRAGVLAVVEDRSLDCVLTPETQSDDTERLQFPVGPDAVDPRIDVLGDVGVDSERCTILLRAEVARSADADRPSEPVEDGEDRFGHDEIRGRAGSGFLPGRILPVSFPEPSRLRHEISARTSKGRPYDCRRNILLAVLIWATLPAGSRLLIKQTTSSS